jgi:hypothetical protein
MQTPPEKLGSFYLGAEYDLKTGQRFETPLNYDARDLTTHAVCVGMTGSGKTGLCISLLEEAALDQVPTILIDPKGDITNLLLQFPELRPEDFQPWINADDARRKGQSETEYAQTTATTWRNGLADWGIGPERIRALQSATQYTIYTPGSDTGMPISLLGSLAAPGLDFDQNAEAIRERIGGTVAALLGLVGLKADPVRSREAILLANIFEHFWSKNENLDLAKLILSIQSPPVKQLGVFDVDTFFPQQDRFSLAMAFNNLVASPSFQYWLKGDPLDVDRLLYDAAGKPRQSIFYIAHLSDEERMFFVTLLLENVLTWVRRQSGTTSLRALLYFDEIFGYFPPTGEPPSKRPLLTLLKQARAFGLGVVLVTQNPVDLDYKGLTNAGTWFIGKLQAERDKARVLEGLEGAIAAAGGKGAAIDYDSVITQLGNRVFLMHNVHAAGPVVFQTRWVMSYLRGPLTKPQVQTLMQPAKQTAAPAPAVAATVAPAVTVPAAAAPAAPAPVAAQPAAGPDGYGVTPQALPPDVPQVYLPVSISEQEAIRQLAQQSGRNLDVTQVQLIYEAGVLGNATVRFVDRKRKLDQQVEEVLVVAAADAARGVKWERAETVAIKPNDLSDEPERVGPEQGPFFGPTPAAASSSQEIKALTKDLGDWLYYNRRYQLTTHPDLGVFQQPDEEARAFKIRLQQAARERRDDEVDALEKKYKDRLERLSVKLKKAERELVADQAAYESRQQQEVVGLGASVLGYFFGRKGVSSAITGAMSKRGQTSRAGIEVEETRQEIEEIQQEIAELENELKEATDEITNKWATSWDDLSSEEIAPQRSDIKVRQVAVAWLPVWLVTFDSGTATVPAYPVASNL